MTCWSIVKVNPPKVIDKLRGFKGRMAVHSKLILIHLLRGGEGDSVMGRACDFSSGVYGLDLRPDRLPSIGLCLSPSETEVMVFPLYLCVAVYKISDVSLGNKALVICLLLCNAPLELEKGILCWLWPVGVHVYAVRAL